MIAIFEQMRNLNIDLKNGKNIRIYSPDVYQSQTFCGKETIKPLPAYALLDNSPNTGWANSEFSEDYAYFIVDFIDKQVNIDSYKLDFSCGPPKEIKVEGSNNGIDWTEIDHNLTTFEAYRSIIYYAKLKKYFRMIKIHQIGESQTNNFRLVLIGIEFYGYLRQIPKIKCSLLYPNCYYIKYVINNIFIITTIYFLIYE